MTPEDDISLLRRSLCEPAAFDVLFVRHHEAIRRYLHARLGQAAVAEDLAAETFVRAFGSRVRFRDRGHGVRAWLFQIATNLLRDEFRTRARHAQKREIPSEAASAAPPGLPADPALTAQLRELPRAQLEVLLLHAWADLGYEEIAVALGIRVGTVRSRLNRARTQLRQNLTTNTDPAHATARRERSAT